MAADNFASFLGLHGSSGLLPGRAVRLAAILRPMLLAVYHKRLRQQGVRAAAPPLASPPRAWGTASEHVGQ